MIKNDFYFELENAYLRSASVEELSNILGKGRAKNGMFLGDMVNGELEIGQISCLLEKIQPASEIIEEIVAEFNLAKSKVSQL